MNISNKSNAVLIRMSASVIMYGGYFLNISKENDGVLVAWTSIADGGEIVENSEKAYSKDWDSLLKNLELIELPLNDNDEAVVSWAISINDSDDNELLTSDELYQDEDCLTRIYEILLDFLGDEEPIFQLKEMLGI